MHISVVRMSLVCVLAPLSQDIQGMGNVLRDSSILDSAGSIYIHNVVFNRLVERMIEYTSINP